MRDLHPDVIPCARQAREQLLAFIDDEHADRSPFLLAVRRLQKAFGGKFPLSFSGPVHAIRSQIELAEFGPNFESAADDLMSVCADLDVEDDDVGHAGGEETDAQERFGNSNPPYELADVAESFRDGVDTHRKGDLQDSD